MLSSGACTPLAAQPRKLAGFVLEGAAEAGAEMRIIDLCDLRVTPCTAAHSTGFVCTGSH
ncbi:MAG: hypothetical protein Q7V05_07875 [Methanoregula sp.]|nr:hypothetical protein [Methanoregula sp.]